MTDTTQRPPHTMAWKELFPSVPVRRPMTPLYVDCPTEERLDRWHSAAPAAFSLGCYVSSEVAVSGIGLLWHNGKVITAAELMPPYWAQMVHENLYSNPKADAKLPVREIDDPCICALGWGNNIYGHFLIEALPRLLLGLKYARSNNVEPKILVRDDAPKWMLDICTKHIGVQESRFVKFDPERERVCLLQGIYPAYAYRGQGFHPATDDLFASIRGLPAQTAPPAQHSDHYFLTRSMLTSTHGGGRTCVNEVQLVEIARDEFGFEIVAPEALFWSEQVKLFRSAQSVIGLYGSALHTAILGSQTIVGVIGMLNPVQLHIGALRRQSMAYQLAGFQLSTSFAVPTDGFRRMLEAVLRSASFTTGDVRTRQI